MKKLLKKLVTAILTLEARTVLKRYHPRVVSVTGNVGKTSTKDAIGSVLRTAYDVRCSAKSFNSALGVPLTILGEEKSGWGSPAAWAGIIWRGVRLAWGRRRSYPEWIVLEVGADEPGDIRSIARWLVSECVVVTRVGKTPVHLGNFPHREALLEEKAVLLTTLRPDGVLVLGIDDADVWSFRERVAPTVRVIGFGTDRQATVRLSESQIAYDKSGAPLGMSGKIDRGGSVVPIRITGVLGRHALFAATAGIAVGSAFEINTITAARALEDAEFPPGRMRILAGMRGSTLIDDSYNASPAATHAALETLESMKTNGRKIAVLGDMFELGEASAEAHREIGEYAASVVSLLIAVGDEARVVHGAARDAGCSSRHVSDARAAAALLQDEIASGDVVLIKGSQGMRMERITEALLDEPESAESVLVRQDAAWKHPA